MIRSVEGLQALKERRSVRSYQPRQIAEEDLQAILQVVTDGPTAHNKQLYHFTVVQDKALLDRMAEEIRLRRTSLPRLLGTLGRDRTADVRAFCTSVASSLARGAPLGQSWRSAAEALPGAIFTWTC